MNASTGVKFCADGGKFLADFGGLLLELHAAVSAGGGGGLGKAVVQRLREFVAQGLELFCRLMAVETQGDHLPSN